MKDNLKDIWNLVWDLNHQFNTFSLYPLANKETSSAELNKCPYYVHNG